MCAADLCILAERGLEQAIFGGVLLKFSQLTLPLAAIRMLSAFHLQGLYLVLACQMQNFVTVCNMTCMGSDASGCVCTIN